MSAGGSDHGSNKYNFPAPLIPQLRKSTSKKSSNAPAMCVTCGLKTELHSMRYKYPEIQLATDNFSSDNLLGEGEYGPVYQGKLKDGQRIAAKVQRGATTTGSAESHSEVYVLNFARHKNIVMLLGYCCKEDQTILVYEYICNKSLNWHLFGKYICNELIAIIQYPYPSISVLTNVSDINRKYRACS